MSKESDNLCKNCIRINKYCRRLFGIFAQKIVNKYLSAMGAQRIIIDSSVLVCDACAYSPELEKDINENEIILLGIEMSEGEHSLCDDCEHYEPYCRRVQKAIVWDFAMDVCNYLGIRKIALGVWVHQCKKLNWDSKILQPQPPTQQQMDEILKNLKIMKPKDNEKP